MSIRSEELRNEAEQTLAALTCTERQFCRRFVNLLLEIAKVEREEEESKPRAPDGV